MVDVDADGEDEPLHGGVGAGGNEVSEVGDHRDGRWGRLDGLDGVGMVVDLVCKELAQALEAYTFGVSWRDMDLLGRAGFA